MRKVFAGLFTALFVVPLTTAALFMFGARSWIVDPGFYKSVVADARLYEGWEADRARALLERARSSGIELDAVAAEKGLAAAFPPAELAGLAASAVDGAFEALRTTRVTEDLRFDYRFLKSSLSDRVDEFAAAYAAALPEGTPASASDLSVRPARVPVAVAAAGAEKALGALVEALPPESRASTASFDAPVFVRGRTYLGSYDAALGMLAAIACLGAVAAAFAASPRWLDRAKWLGGTLGFPAFLLVASGAVLLLGASAFSGAGAELAGGYLAPYIAEGMRSGGEVARRLAPVLAPVVSRIGMSFFLAGLGTAAVSIALNAVRFAPARDEEDDEAGGAGA